MVGKEKQNNVQLTREELFREIVEYLDSNNTCTLAFCCHDVPRAMPVEYANDGSDLYVVSEGMSKTFYETGKKEKVLEWKRMFIDRNPRCAVGLISPYFGYASTRGLRMWGKARVFQKGDPEWDKGITLLKVERNLPDFGQVEVPDFLIITKIVPEMMEYANMVKGIKRAVWTAPGVNPDTWNCPWEFA